MLNKYIDFIARNAGKERSMLTRILSLAFGTVVVFAIVPAVLGITGHLLAGHFVLKAPAEAEIIAGTAGMSAGVFFLAWAVWTFWFAGKGTPVPLASPVKLVTNGPFRYTRNPIKFGIILLYFGMGAVFDGLLTGFFMSAVVLILGTIYHKNIEERELLIRFGSEYENYRRRTSFFFPLPPRK